MKRDREELFCFYCEILHVASFGPCRPLYTVYASVETPTEWSGGPEGGGERDCVIASAAAGSAGV